MYDTIIVFFVLSTVGYCHNRWSPPLIIFFQNNAFIVFPRLIFIIKINLLTKLLFLFAQVLSTLVSVENSLKVSYPELPEFSLKTMIIFNKNVTNTTTSKNQSNIDKLGRVMKKVLRISLYQSLFPDDLKDGLLRLSHGCLLYTSPSPRDKRQSRMPSSA